MINPKRTDSNQSQIVEAFRKLGYSVLLLHETGHGCPDILIAKNGIMNLVEIKTEKGKLNERQEHFIATWNSQIFIVRNVDEAIQLDKDLLEPIKPNRERYGT